jgi:hypothetical protein
LLADLLNPYVIQLRQMSHSESPPTLLLVSNPEFAFIVFLELIPSINMSFEKIMVSVQWVIPNLSGVACGACVYGA